MSDVNALGRLRHFSAINTRLGNHRFVDRAPRFGLYDRRLPRGLPTRFPGQRVNTRCAKKAIDRIAGRIGGGISEMLDFVQQLVSGIALGCVYGLIALGFVLIYKATEVVNFAQGDLMMLGGFFAFTFITQLGTSYWVGLILTVLAMAAFGALVERIVVRPILGYPQFSIVMVTIGLGFLLRSVAGMIWGTDDLQIATPFSGGVARFGALVLGDDKLSVIVATILLCLALWLYFN